jgi:hypothetical protein
VSWSLTLVRLETQLLYSVRITRYCYCEQRRLLVLQVQYRDASRGAFPDYSSLASIRSSGALDRGYSLKRSIVGKCQSSFCHLLPARGLCGLGLVGSISSMGP